MEELINLHLNQPMNMDGKIERENYDIYYSTIIDDEFWNYAYLKNNDINIEEVYSQVREDMEKINRQPLIYITSNILNSTLKEKIDKSNLKVEYTDVWMTLDNLEKFEKHKSKIEFSLQKVDKKTIEDFIQAVMDGFSGDNPDDPYGDLSDGYKIALRRSLEIKDDEYKIIHYLGRHKQEAISTATAICKGNNAIIYNVTTNRKYQKQGVCKQMMSEIIEDLTKLNIHTVCVQTEQGFYTVDVYKRMGFEEKILGIAYKEV